MSAAYDNYDYPSYWHGREYEHQSEVIALKSFLSKIPSINNLVEIGSGYGRLTPTYLFRSKHVTLVDPSAKLLKTARKSFLKYKKVKYIHTKIENIDKKIKKRSCDVIIMVRVIHHIGDVDMAFKHINSLLKDGGYFILEFANKRHFKSSLRELVRGNITFPLDIFPKDISSKSSIKSRSLPFINYHPEIICHTLEMHGFEIIEVRSVSNVRSPFLKRSLPQDILLSLEKVFQTLLSKIYFGPSIFILAKK